MDENTLIELVRNEATREGIRHLVRAAGSKILGTIRDRLQDFREDNTEKFFQEFYSMVNPLGIHEPRTVPPKVWYRILEGASLEDDDLLRKRYAAMLANAMDPNFKINIHPMFVETLKLLSPLEVRFLDELYKTTTGQTITHRHHIDGSTILDVADDWEVPDEKLLTLLESLRRHGLLNVTEHTEVFSSLRQGSYRSVAQYTRLGFEFVAACKAPEPKPSETQQ